MMHEITNIIGILCAASGVVVFVISLLFLLVVHLGLRDFQEYEREE